MRITSSALVILTGVLNARAAAPSSSPDKPAMDPPYPDKTLNAGIQAHVKPTKATTHPWDAAFLPQACLNLAKKHDLKVADFSAFDVTYEDCGTSWTFCHHRDAKFSFNDMVVAFGSMPVRMRSYIRYILNFSQKKIDIKGWRLI